ncbi:MAG: hypothetical protein AB7I25_07090 [Vicinamibacterales bacterium]
MTTPSQRAGSDDTLLVPLPASMDVEDIDHHLHSLPYADLRNSQNVIIRLHPSAALALFEHADFEHILANLKHRTTGIPLSILTFRDGTMQVFDCGAETWQEASPAVNTLCEADLWSLLHEPGCLLPPADEFHYEGPNRSHFSGFVRPGLAMLSTAALDSFAFWLLPHFTPGQPILVDTGHLLSLSLHVPRYLQTHTQNGTLPNSACDALRGYWEDDTDLLQRLLPLRARTHENHLLVVISARSSGRLESRIRALAAPLWEEITVVNLYGIRHGDEDAHVMCTLPGAYARLGVAPCRLCSSGVPVVKVDPRTYLLELSAVAKRETLNRRDAASARQFFERYRGQDVVTLHRTRRDPGEPPRHHMIHLDVARMLDSPTFTDKLDAQVSALGGGVELVLAPSHQCAGLLGQRAAALLGTDLVICDAEQLRHLSVAQRIRITQSRSILIVDDVITTGTRLRGYQARLRALEGFNASTTVRLLVGVARPTSETQLVLARDMLGHESAFSCVEKVVLPNWDQRDCPWCAERALLEAADINDSDYFRERLAAVRNVDGLTGDIFIRLDQTLPEMVMTDSPVFGSGLTQSELFMAVASALQEMRNSGRLLEYPQPPLTRVLSPDGYITGRYFESVIDAAICRASRRFDLRAAAIEPELIAKVGRRLAEPISADFRGELLLAIALGKLPTASEVHDAVHSAEATAMKAWESIVGIAPIEPSAEEEIESTG